MDLSEEIQRGIKAQSILESEIYQESIDTVRQMIIDQWAKSPIRDHEGQHELRLMLKLLDDLTGNIKQIAETGKLAQIHIENEKKGIRRFFA